MADPPDPEATPGEKFIYHVAANYLPIAEIIERLSGKDVRDFIRERIAEPLGLPDLRLGIDAATKPHHVGQIHVGAVLRIR